LHHELHQAGIQGVRQVALPVVYRGVKLEIGYRIDLLVEDLVIVEIKAVDAISPVHQAQVISYLKVSGRSTGLLINFNVVHLRDGITLCEWHWVERKPDLQPLRARSFTKEIFNHLPFGAIIRLRRVLL
jgi:GxxExxY protein